MQVQSDTVTPHTQQIAMEQEGVHVSHTQSHQVVAFQQPRPLARFHMTSDLRAATGLTRTHLDFYLREGVIVPTARTESGYLLFDDTELATLRQVIAWRSEGVGIREIRERLSRATESPES